MSTGQDGPSLSQLDAIVFDFDGVMTDNYVYVSQDGTELVRCSRADGLAIEALQRLRVRLFVLSAERNPVVTARAAKLRVPVVQGSANKHAALVALAADAGFDLSRTLYVGNDVNDLHAMSACRWSACPADSHPRVLEAASLRLRTRGGEGVVRELAEDVFRISIAEALHESSR